MIPKEWLKRKVTRHEVENLRRIDFLRNILPPDFTEDNVVEKSDWWKRPMMQENPQWEPFISNLLDGDELWEYKMPVVTRATWTSQTGIGGYAILRNGKIISYMTTSAQ